ncbi:hypothetical protein GCM10027404_32810 [Arthrobacter tumbae]
MQLTSYRSSSPHRVPSPRFLARLYALRRFLTLREVWTQKGAHRVSEWLKWSLGQKGSSLNNDRSSDSVALEWDYGGYARGGFVGIQ